MTKADTSDEELRKAIIQVAASRFDALGMKKATMQCIADEAGVDRAALKRLFGSKQLLALAVQNHEIEKLKLDYMQRMPDASIDEMIKFIIRTRFEFMEKNRERTLLFVHNAIMGRDPWSKLLDKVIWGLSIEFVALIEKGVRSGSIRKVDAQVVVRTITSIYLTSVVNIGLRSQQFKADEMWGFAEPQISMLLESLKK